jgi:DNA-binding MarR family transcriptional regulator
MARSSALSRESDVDYGSLAEFRYQLRLFLRFSEEASRAAGLEPQQHQLLLVAKGAPPDQAVTVGYLSDRLQLRHHSTVELIDRLEARGLVRRRRASEDRRRVLVALTRAGERVLAQLSLHHIEAVRSARGLVRSLDALMKKTRSA